jgi:Ras homolog gene family, member A
MLVGCKSDLRHKRTCIELLRTQGLTPVTPEQGQAVAQRMGASYIECSAKEGKGVHQVFEQAIDTAVRAEDETYEAPVTGKAKVKKAKKRKCAFL